MMSPKQALEQISASGMVVMQAGGVSRQYMVGELDAFPAEAKRRLLNQTLAAGIEAAVELGRGQDISWICRKCGFDGNSFPLGWPDVKPSKSTEWPYPSDAHFRELSKKLVADHGTVLRVTDCGSMSAVRWRFIYKDRHEIVVGNPGWPVQTAKVDVDFFPGMVGPEGKTYAKVFFTAAGIDTSGLDIFGMPDGADYDVRDGKLVRS